MAGNPSNISISAPIPPLLETLRILESRRIVLAECETLGKRQHDKRGSATKGTEQWRINGGRKMLEKEEKASGKSEFLQERDRRRMIVHAHINLSFFSLISKSGIS